jgi:hypothetical protein
MEVTTLTTGTVKFDGDAHGIAFSVYVREDGQVKLWVKRGGMAILPGRARCSAATSRTWNSDRSPDRSPGTASTTEYATTPRGIPAPRGS